MKQSEPLWWIPLARRVAVWGAQAGVSVGALFFTLVMLFVLIYNLGDAYALQRMGFSGCLLDAIRRGLIIGLTGCGIGVIFGCAVGFCAPPRETKALFSSPFCRRVFAGTLIFWLLISFVAGVFATLISILFEPWVWWLSSEIWLVVAAYLCFALSLWCAINRALHASKNPLL